MKKTLFFFVLFLLVLSITTAFIPLSAQSGASTTDKEPVELIVFAAASMTESMTRIAELYKDAAPEVTIIYNFDSSGTLKTQIQEGADCDIFISAGQKQMNQLDIEAKPEVNTEKLDFVLKDSRFDFVENTPVLIVPEGSKKDISDFKDVLTDKVEMIALGNSDVPVGQYSEEIYTNLGIWEDLKASGKISFASNVKEVLAQVEAAAVDCGVVYSTDAATAKGVEVVAAAPADSYKAIKYPAAILKTSANVEAAEAFITFLKGPEATEVLKENGFGIPKK